MKLSLRCEGYGLLEDGRAIAIIRIFETESAGYQIQILNVVRVFSQEGVALGPWVDPTVYRDLESAKRDGTTPIRNKVFEVSGSQIDKVSWFPAAASPARGRLTPRLAPNRRFPVQTGAA